MPRAASLGPACGNITRAGYAARRQPYGRPTGRTSGGASAVWLDESMRSHLVRLRLRDPADHPVVVPVRSDPHQRPSRPRPPDERQFGYQLAVRRLGNSDRGGASGSVAGGEGDDKRGQAGRLAAHSETSVAIVLARIGSSLSSESMLARLAGPAFANVTRAPSSRTEKVRRPRRSPLRFQAGHPDRVTFGHSTAVIIGVEKRAGWARRVPPRLRRSRRPMNGSGRG